MKRDGSRQGSRQWALAIIVVGALVQTTIADELPAKNETARSEVHGTTTPSAAELLLLENRAIHSAATRGARWLESTQRPDGLFVYGWIPSLNQPIQEDNQLRQAGAAAALARAAAVTRDESMMTAARQAIIVLLATYTEPDPDRPDEIRPTIRTIEQHPLGFAALTLLAISELPNPGETLVRQSHLLANYIATRQLADGTFSLKTGALIEEADSNFGIDYYPGEALYALMRSYPNASEQWKLEAVAKAYKPYRKHWAEDPNAAFVPWQTGAYAEAFLLTKEKAYAQFVFEMNDWLVRLQYDDPKAVREEWLGGFGSFQYGRILRTTPGVTTASYLEALVDAYRVAELLEDETRMSAYRHAARSAIRFLTANQYTMRRMSHFQPQFAHKLNGAFHASVDDGVVRIDFAQHAVSGMFHYLTHVAEFKNASEEKPNLPSTLPTAN